MAEIHKEHFTTKKILYQKQKQPRLELFLLELIGIDSPYNSLVL